MSASTFHHRGAAPARPVGCSELIQRLRPKKTPRDHSKAATIVRGHKAVVHIDSSPALRNGEATVTESIHFIDVFRCTLQKCSSLPQPAMTECGKETFRVPLRESSTRSGIRRMSKFGRLGVDSGKMIDLRYSIFNRGKTRTEPAETW